MRLNVKTPITDYSGQPIIQGTKEKPEPMTIGSMMIGALNSPKDEDKSTDAKVKIARAVLSQEIFSQLKEEADGMVDVEHEVIVEIKRFMNQLFAPLTLMRAFDIFDPKVEEVSKKKTSK